MGQLFEVAQREHCKRLDAFHGRRHPWTTARAGRRYELLPAPALRSLLRRAAAARGQRRPRPICAGCLCVARFRAGLVLRQTVQRVLSNKASARTP